MVTCAYPSLARVEYRVLYVALFFLNVLRHWTAIHMSPMIGGALCLGVGHRISDMYPFFLLSPPPSLIKHYREHRKARLISQPVHLISQPVVG
jgi:hypothetical protein